MTTQTGILTPPTPTLAPNPPQRVRGRNIIAVASGKGGVGKTWFSITLCHALALAGRRVLLMDGDLGLANIDIQLGYLPDCDLGSVLTGKKTLNQAAVHYDRCNFDIIAGRSGSGSLANIPLSRLQMLGDDLGLLAANYDHVVVDLGAGVEKTIRTFSQQAGTILVVTTDEPTSLTDAYTFIKVTHLERPGTDMRVVVNMANSIREGERIYNTLLKVCEGFLKISPPLAGVIRRDLKVRESIGSQTPILIRTPNAEAATDVEQIARGLLRR